ncbi:MAG: FGGY family carbohydrate kinase, partial [Rhodospirillales bacterium]|nr:FGGY family carbohydrate kinase [Rhodospirillales bacterium]
MVGVDIGTQSLKAVVLDDRLHLLGEAATAYEPDYPRPGWAEQSPALWEDALGLTIAKALAAAGRAAAEVRTLGIAGQLDGCIAVDAEGRALGPCIIWMDRRAEAQAKVVEPDELRRVTGVTRDATHMAAKIRWLKQEAFEASRFHQPVSYLVARLTGAQVFDHGLASTTMLYSLATRGYVPELLAAFGIEENELPAIAEAHEPAGRLTAEGAQLCGLPQGTVVAVGTGDDFSTPLGAGLVTPGRVACVLGTAEVVGALDGSAKIDPTGLVETHSYAGGRFYIENPGWISGGALAWLRGLLRPVGFAELDRLAAEVPPGAGGVTFLPALNGAMAPEWIASARGCFYGLTPAHGAGHLARAVLEGCAFAMRDVIERLVEMDVATEALLLLGGGAKSRLWAQIRADCTGLPAQIPVVRDTSPVGAA